MSFEFISLEASGGHGLNDFQTNSFKDLPEPARKTLKILHEITLGTKEISSLFKAHEDEACSCCDETQSEFAKVKLEVKHNIHTYIYSFNVFLPNEMIFEESLYQDNNLLFKKSGNEVSFPDAPSLFERNDRFYFPVSQQPILKDFRQKLEKSLALPLEIA